MTNPKGRFGIHGGQYIPETLMNAVIELEAAYDHYKNDPDFNQELSELLNEYAGRPTVEHFDMYRVNGWDDLYSTGFFDYLDTDCVLVIEWSENIAGALPDGVISIDLRQGEKEQDRIITIAGWKGGGTPC